MIPLFRDSQLLVFLVAGGVAAIANFGSRIIYSSWISFSASIILAYVTGMIVAFLLARMFVFRHGRQLIHQSIFFFILVNLAAAAQTWLISMVLVYYVLPLTSIQYYTDEIAHAVGVVVPVFTSFLGHKHLSFKA